MCYNVPSCQAIIRKLIYSFMLRVDGCVNDISGICRSSLRYRSRIRCSWIGRLYTQHDRGLTWAVCVCTLLWGVSCAPCTLYVIVCWCNYVIQIWTPEVWNKVFRSYAWYYHLIHCEVVYFCLQNVISSSFLKISTSNLVHICTEYVPNTEHIFRFV